MENTQPDVVKPTTKKVYTKRKEQILTTIAEDEKNTEEKLPVQEKNQTEEKSTVEEVEPDAPDEPATKKIRVTKEEPVEQEQPCLVRGAFIKPLLLAGVASASFFINHYYSTTTAPQPKPLAVGIKKKIVSPSGLQGAVHQSVMRRASVVPSGVQGFTKKTYN